MAQTFLSPIGDYERARKVFLSDAFERQCFRSSSASRPANTGRLMRVALFTGMPLNESMATGRRPLYRTLASLSRVNLLRALQSGDRMTVADLAETTGLHHNTAREHLDRLIDAGFVSREPEVKTSKGRPRQLYSIGQSRADPRLLKNVDDALHRSDQVRRLLPVEDVSAPAAPTDENDPRTDQLDLLDDHMDQCGIDATVEQGEESAQMQMHNCPYSSLAKANPQVCQAHLGMVREVLHRIEGPLEAERISPFVNENQCTLDLRETPETG